jgi:shikimate dehydrogenase
MFQVAAIFAQPVLHSRSPLIHGFWLKHYNISGAYLRREVSIDALPELLQNFQKLGLAGANLSLPLKEAACAYVELDEVARKLEAVNTIWLEGNKLYGTNTDVFGFTASLDEQTPNWRNALSNVAILGAGGASKAVIYALLQAHAESITLFNRTLSRAENLGLRFGKTVKSKTWNEFSEFLPSVSLLVNATSLGMKGQETLQLDMGKLPKSAIVADIVYTPLETNLLRDARREGLATADGLAMLLHQAVPGFERWFGVKPQVTRQLRDLISADLQARP